VVCKEFLIAVVCKEFLIAVVCKEFLIAGGLFVSNVGCDVVVLQHAQEAHTTAMNVKNMINEM